MAVRQGTQGQLGVGGGKSRTPPLAGLSRLCHTRVKEAASFTEALRLGLEAAEGTGINLGTEKEVTLVDGSKATAVKVDWKVMGYPGESYAVGVKKDNKWIIVNVTTVTLLSPYDEALFSEITNTLQFK